MTSSVTSKPSSLSSSTSKSTSKLSSKSSPLKADKPKISKDKMTMSKEGRSSERSGSIPNLAAAYGPPAPKLLGQGNAGEDVRNVQNLLNKGGESLKSDGIFGPLTQDAVRKFQEQNGLRVDGVVGPETLAALNAAKGKGEAPAPKAAQKAEVSGLPQLPQAPKAELTSLPQPPQGAKTEASSLPQLPQAPKAQVPGLPPAPSAEQPKAPVAPQPKAEAPATPGDFTYLSPAARQSLEQNGQLDSLRALPKELSNLYPDLSARTREQLFQQLNSISPAGPVKDLFVSGKINAGVFSMNTFDYMGDELTKAVKSNKTTAQEAEPLKKALPFLKKLAPEQREAIANMILLQQGK